MEELEKLLKTLNARCAGSTGLESFPHYNARRREVLLELEKLRHLTRWEYICCYGYPAWRKYADTHNLPEDHPHADQGIAMYKVFLTIGRFTGGNNDAVVKSHSPNDLANAAEAFWNSVPDAAQMGTQVLIWDNEFPTPQNLLAVWSMFDKSQPLRMM